MRNLLPKEGISTDQKFCLTNIYVQSTVQLAVSSFGFNKETEVHSLSSYRKLPVKGVILNDTSQVIFNSPVL